MVLKVVSEGFKRKKPGAKTAFSSTDTAVNTEGPGELPAAGECD